MVGKILKFNRIVRMKAVVKFVGLAALILIVIAGVTLTFLHFKNRDRSVVTSGNMAPTLIANDVVGVDLHAYDHKDPDRGEIVVYRVPGNSKYVLVGRVVGIPGDQVSLSPRTLIVNGKLAHTTSHKITSPFDKDASGLYEEATETLGQHTYPVWYSEGNSPFFSQTRKMIGGQYYIMGDNRDKSRDSRDFGPIPRSLIVGQAKKIVDSARAERVGKEIQ